MFYKGKTPQKTNDDNLVIEPISSIELAKFYSIEDQNNGLMFHKNLCDSFIVNESQGTIYFLMQEHKKNLYANKDQTHVKFVVRKLGYREKELKVFEDPGHKNKLLQADLNELRNLKYKVLTFGSNELQ